MKDDKYFAIVGIIHRCRTWIDVLDCERIGSMLVGVGCNSKTITCRMLTLFARRDRGVYKKGNSWDIPEFRLERAVAALKRARPDFARRWKENTIIKEDVEFLISHASYNLIKLELTDELD